jgi:hypothetical protein
MMQNTLQMEWCLNCHRNPAVNLRPTSEIYNMAWAGPSSDKPVWCAETGKGGYGADGAERELHDDPILGNNNPRWRCCAGSRSQAVGTHSRIRDGETVSDAPMPGMVRCRRATRSSPARWTWASI